MGNIQILRGITALIVVGIIATIAFYMYSTNNGVVALLGGGQEQGTGSDSIVGGQERGTGSVLGGGSQERGTNRNSNNGDRTPPQEAIEACENNANGDICEFQSPRGQETGVCETKDNLTACKPSGQNGNEGDGERGNGNYYDQGKSISGYNIEQAIGDHAQETTIAYSALANLTGNTCADSFIPPGKVADFFGFQYLRDSAVDGMGHSTDFVTNSGNSLLYILNDGQEEILSNLIELQDNLINEYAYSRYPLLLAFRMQLEGDVPTGKTVLSKDAVIEYSEELYTLDAKISIQRARAFGEILKSLDNDQRELLDSLIEGGFYSWTLKENVEKRELMGIASELFGWYAGDIEADTYFCPERHGTYFGSFYMKDAPAMASQARGVNYVIDETITGNKGELLLNMLEDGQSAVISEIVDIQSDNLHGIVDVREAMSLELRKFMTQSTIDEGYLYSLAKQYGALDGENVYNYAMSFAEVMDTLTNEQKADLIELRDLEDYPCSDNYIYVYSKEVNRSSIDSSYLAEPVFLFE